MTSPITSSELSDIARSVIACAFTKSEPVAVDENWNVQFETTHFDEDAEEYDFPDVPEGTSVARIVSPWFIVTD